MTMFLKLSHEGAVVFDAAERETGNTAPRQFSGVAHSGQVFSRYGERFIVDLSSIKFREKTGVLLEHNPNEKVGVGTLSIGEQGLMIHGSLLNTEQAQYVAQTADDGFPWELSAHLQSEHQEQVNSGDVVVNGLTVSAPITVLRDCAVREVSFVAVGADAHTHAVVLSNFEQAKKGNETMSEKTDNQQALIDELNAKLGKLEAENAELKALVNKMQKKQTVDKKLLSAGFLQDENGGFKGVNAPTYDVLLTLDDGAADSVIDGLKLAFAFKQPEQPTSQLPAFLTEDKREPNEMKLSGSLADLAKTYVEKQAFL